MPRKRRSFRSRWLPGRATGLLVALVAIAIAGIALVKFLESPRGTVLLLDLGFADRYDAVRDTLGAGMRKALDELGLGGSLQEKSAAVTVHGRKVLRHDWSLTAAPSQSLVRINVALTEAVRQSGGVVRSSKEASGGAELVLDVGSRRYTTQRIIIRRGRDTAETPRGGEARRPGEAREFAESHEPEEPSAVRPCKIALVVDDFGYTKGALVEEFFDLDIAFTASVIPTLPYAGYVLTRAAGAGKQTILHLPMEAESFTSDVPAVLTSMSRSEIVSLVDRYLDATPGVIGVNNHLGSVATRDEAVMEAVLDVVKRRNLFFFDSLTSSQSVAYTTARRLGVPTARNDLFIDTDTEDEHVVGERLNRLLVIAKKRGSAVGIGHPRSWTLTAIREFRERTKSAGVEFVFLSSLVE
jgi:polysaccharide deacetylase 2 family uncharacterized protein YibQ